MPDEISTFFLLANSTASPLGGILNDAIGEGWEIEWMESKNKYEFLVDYEQKLAEDMEDVVSEIDNGERSSVWIERGDCRICIELNTTLLADQYMPNVHIWASKYDGFLHQDSSRSQQQARETVETYLDVIGLAIESIDPSWGFGKLGDPYPESKLPTKHELKTGYRGTLSWVTVFNEAAVEQIGRDHLLSTPSYYVRELKTGHVMVILSDNPVEPAEEFKDTEERARAHLGLDS
jgi:hypothetical protein